MATAENVAIESDETTVGEVIDLVLGDDWGKPVKPKASGGSWAFDGERVIIDAFIVAKENALAEEEALVQMRWAVCLERETDEENGWIVAEVIGLPGTATQGRNKAEALDNVREALSLVLEQLSAEGANELSFPPYEIPAGAQVVYVAV